MPKRENDNLEAAITERILYHTMCNEELKKDYMTRKYEKESSKIRDFYMIVAEWLIIQELEDLLKEG